MKKQHMSYSNDYADILIGSNKDQQPASWARMM